LGIAVGDIGLPYSDFCMFTPEEFGSIYKAYAERQETQYRTQWECMRTLAFFTVQPYAKKGLTPHKLFSFPWDGKAERDNKDSSKISKSEALARFRKVLEKTRRI
jgi:hypothetical protein